MTNPFPLTITLSESIDAEITSNQILAGLRTRKIFDTSKNKNESVASFGKNYVLGKPDWLKTICQQNFHTEEHSTSSSSSADFDAIVSFGDGQDLCVKIRNKSNHDGSGAAGTPSTPSKNSKKSSSSKKEQPSSLPFVTFMLGVFLDEGTAGRPADMLDPRGMWNNDD